MFQKTQNPQSRLRGAASLVVASAALLALAGCGAAGDDAAGAAVDGLSAKLKEVQRLNEAQAARIDRLERRIDGLTGDIDRLSRTQVESSLAAHAEAELAQPSDEAAAAMQAAAAPGVDIEKLLDTEDGQAAVEKAMAAVQQKRDDERRERWVGMMLDRFAADANLTDAQTDDMRRVVSTSFKQIGEVWSGIRGNDDMSAADRATAREEAMAKMEEIRRQTDDEVKGILTPSQFSLYEEQSQRMRGGFGGGRGAGFGRDGANR